MHGHTAIDKEVILLEGWAKQRGLAKHHAMYGLILENKIKISVEIGVWGGQSLLAMLFACADLAEGGMKDAYVVAVDPMNAEAACEGTHMPVNQQWNRGVNWEKIYSGMKTAIYGHKLGDFVKIHREKSLAVAGSFADGVIGLLHQDGNKSEEVTCAEVEAFAPKIKDKGYWVQDGCGWTEHSKRTVDKSRDLLLEKGFVVMLEGEDFRILQKGGVAPPIGNDLAAASSSLPEPATVVDGRLILPGQPLPPEPTVAELLERIKKLEAQVATAQAKVTETLAADPWVAIAENAMEPATPEPTVASAEVLPELAVVAPKKQPKVKAKKEGDEFP